MALLYHSMKHTLETTDVMFRYLDEDGDYKIALTFTPEEDEEGVVEVLLTEEEVKEAYDLLFNR